MKNKLITKDPDIHSGDPVFTGTRVPVKLLFNYIDAGKPLEEFLEGYPHISREHVEAVLKERERYRKNKKAAE